MLQAEEAARTRAVRRNQRASLRKRKKASVVVNRCDHSTAVRSQAIRPRRGAWALFIMQQEATAEFKRGSDMV